jgi:nitrogen regulatory protein P-II 1
MKKIEAIIRAEKFARLKKALANQNVDFFTYQVVKGVGNQEAIGANYRGASYLIDSFDRIQLSIVVGENKADKIVDIILKEAHTGKVGDGKIFISNIDTMIRIRDGKVNEKAVELALV